MPLKGELCSSKGREESLLEKEQGKGRHLVQGRGEKEEVLGIKLLTCFARNGTVNSAGGKKRLKLK